jgi:predicted O-methyltransferase YrrM
MRSFKHWNRRYVVDRLKLFAFEKRNPEMPWLTSAMIAVLDTWLRPTDNGLEFGSGRSTRWFAARVNKLTSVEHDASWHAKVAESLTSSGLVAKVDYRLSPGGDDPSAREKYLDVLFNTPPASLDFVLVDGIHRDHCAERSVDLVRPGGIIIVDNVNWFLPRALPSCAPNSRGPKDAPASPLWERFAERTADWRRVWTTNGVTDTAFFVKPLVP